jgi:hypothetical protein
MVIIAMGSLGGWWKKTKERRLVSNAMILSNRRTSQAQNTLVTHRDGSDETEDLWIYKSILDSDDYQNKLIDIVAL